MPSCRDLPSNGATELERFRDEDARALLQFEKPLSAFTCPNVTSITVLEFELLGLSLGDLNSLKIVDELDFLIEDLLVGIVATEQFRLCTIKLMTR